MRRRFDQPALRNHCRPLRGESAEQVYIFANKTKDRARGPRDASPNCAFRQINFLLLLRHRWFHRARPFQVCRGLRPPNRWLKVIENDGDRLIDWNLPCAFLTWISNFTKEQEIKIRIPARYFHADSFIPFYGDKKTTRRSVELFCRSSGSVWRRSRWSNSIQLSINHSRGIYS